jgi:hypothetical protein
MDANDDAGNLTPLGALRFFASELLHGSADIDYVESLTA